MSHKDVLAMLKLSFFSPEFQASQGMMQTPSNKKLS